MCPAGRNPGASLLPIVAILVVLAAGIVAAVLISRGQPAQPPDPLHPTAPGDADPGEGSPGEGAGDPAPAPGSPEALLDRAAELWGGRRQMVEETGFHIHGKVLLSAGGSRPIEMENEVWARHDPRAIRTRQFVTKRDASGNSIPLNEQIMIVNGEDAWVTDLTTGKLKKDELIGATVRKQPTPRKVLLHREHNLRLVDKGDEPIGELHNLPAKRILALDPEENFVYAYIDEDGMLRKLTYRLDGGQWASAVFETFRDPNNSEGLSPQEKVSYYVGGELQRTFLWGKRESSPALDEKLFQP